MISFVAIPTCLALFPHRGSRKRTNCQRSISRTFRSGAYFLGDSACLREAVPSVWLENVGVLVQTSTLERKSAIIVVDHGSKRDTANDMLLALVQDIKAQTNTPVFAAHMELAKPTIAEAVDECAGIGARHIIVVPFFLSPGRHVLHDIPRLTLHAVNKHEGMSYDVRPPIGTHPDIIGIVMDRARHGQ